MTTQPTLLRRAGIALLAFIAMAGSARASINWVTTTQVSSRAGVLSAVAYDDKHQVYLVTWEQDRQVWARFHDTFGTPLGAAFPVATLLQSFAGVPKVAYSRGTNDDIFMIAFSSDALIFDRSKSAFAQFVRFTGTGPTGGQFVGGNFDVSQFSRDASRIQTVFDITYNPAVRRFLVAWDERANNGPADAYVRAFSTAGVPATGDINVNAPLSAQSQGAHTVAVSPAHNRFVVAWQGDHPTQNAIGIFAAILDGNNGSPMAGANFLELTRGGFPIEPNAVYLPDRGAFLVMWTQLSASARWIEGRIVGIDGTLQGGIFTLMSGRNEGAVDSAFSDTTRTTLLSAMSAVKLVRGVELNGQGQPTSAAYNLSTVNSVIPGDGGGSFNPHVVQSVNGGFGLAYTLDFQRTILETYQGTAVAPQQPETPAASPNPRMSLDVPGNGSVVQSNFAVAGWALDLGAPSGPGVSTVHVWAFPTNGAPAIFLGAATMGGGRPDVSGYFGRPDAVGCGFNLSATLNPGTYDISAFAFSTVSGSFNQAQNARVTVGQPGSNPRMALDFPSPNQTVSNSFLIAGWAVDLGASSGAGVEAVHVWAYPLSGAAPIFVGAVGVGGARPDVGFYFGNGRFGASGFGLLGSLPAGDYDLVVFGFSSVTRTFNQTVIRRIRVL